MKTNSGRLFVTGLTATLAVLLGFALPADTASAATITVNTFLDEFDVAPNLNCSLREAIESANKNANHGGCLGLGAYGNDLIVFDAGVTSVRLSIVAPSGADNDNNAYLDLDIGAANSGDLTIQGAGVGGVSVQPLVVNWADRIFDIVTPASVTLTGLTIQGGAGPFNFETGFGEPCFGGGGGVRNRSGANLTLSGVVIQSNGAPNDGGGACQFGGALSVLNSVVQDNVAGTGNGGGIFDRSAQLLIQDSEILSNTTPAGQGGNGGGLWMSDGPLGKQIIRSAIGYNRADASGGGLYQDSASRGLTMLTSVVLSNTSGAFVQSAGNGGGIWSGSSLAMTGTAVLSNTALITGGAIIRGGGGIYQNLGILHIYDSRVSHNRAHNIMAGLVGGGGLYNREGQVTLISATVQHNLVDGTSPASREGGGIFNYGQMAIIDSQVDFNRVDGLGVSFAHSVLGGGIANWDLGGSVRASLLVQNSSVSSNTAQGYDAEAAGGGIFNVGGGGAQIINSVLRNNLAQSNDDASGGGVQSYGSASPLTVTQSSVISNAAVAPLSFGGGLANAILIRETSIYSNSAGEGGGVHNILYNDGARIIDSNIRYNTATVWDGGGVSNNSQDVALIGVTVCDNTAARNGGGVYNIADLRIDESVICDNTAAGDGGGVHTLSFTITRRLELINSTISGNSAANGGGLHVMTSTSYLTHTTIASNTSGVRVASGAAWARATLLAYNAGGNCIGLLNNAGFSMSSDSTCGALQVDNPLLRPLALNGGQTLNHALPLGSPALDKVPAAQCDALNDQRGVARPQNSGCDAGAFELALTRVYLPRTIKP